MVFEISNIIKILLGGKLVVVADKLVKIKTSILPLGCCLFPASLINSCLVQ